MLKEYQTVSEIYGPLMLVEGVDGAKYGQIVDIEIVDGTVRHGQILQVENDKVLVQVFEGTEGINVDKSTARIEVEDNGSGMNKETQKRVFEPFFTTKPVDEGTGLGLSVSYMIITNNHRGTIEVESELGKGTKFIIRLPLERKTL